MLNSRGEWQSYPQWEDRPLKDIVIADYVDKKVMARAAAKAARFKAKAGLASDEATTSEAEVKTGAEATPEPAPATDLVGPPKLRSLLTESGPLEKIGPGRLVVLEETPAGPIHGREVLVGETFEDGQTVVLAKWVRRLTNWNGRQTSLAAWRELVVPIIQREMAADHLPVVSIVEEAGRIVARVSLAEQTARALVDRHGVALWRPREREIAPEDCARCEFMAKCKLLPNAVGTASLWRRLALVDAAGVPTLRGRVTSYFSGGDGLAVAAALEDSSYALEDLIYDLTNLDAGFRFCARDDRWGGRLAMACRAQYGTLSVPGYLESGVPPRYGSGAEIVVRSVHKDPYSKHRFTTEYLGDGDIDRIIIEWRSMLRVITHAPPLEWPRWTGLQKIAKTFLREVESPTQTDLPPLEYHQTKRVDHRLIMRRH